MQKNFKLSSKNYKNEVSTQYQNNGSRRSKVNGNSFLLIKYTILNFKTKVIEIMKI